MCNSVLLKNIRRPPNTQARVFFLGVRQLPRTEVFFFCVGQSLVA
jgi:hypothetical protein